MAKKKKREDLSASAAASDSAPFNAAFAGLAGLRDQLPSVEGAPAAAPDLAPADSASEVWMRRKLVVRKEKKGRGGKTITRIDGLEVEDLGAWAKRMAKALGCGATVEEDSILLQGQQTDRAADWLKSQGARQVVIGN